MSDGWISVKDRLPQPGQLVLVFDPGLCNRFSVERVSARTGDWVHANDITHWMPLPPPPAPTLTVKEALREAISLLDTARQSTMGRRELPLESWFGWSGDIALAIPRLRAALESEE